MEWPVRFLLEKALKSSLSMISFSQLMIASQRKLLTHINLLKGQNKCFLKKWNKSFQSVFFLKNKSNIRKINLFCITLNCIQSLFSSYAVILVINKKLYILILSVNFFLLSYVIIYFEFWNLHLTLMLVTSRESYW